jgi:hypothetical protein
MATAAAVLRGEGRARPPSSGPRQHGATWRRGLRGPGRGRLGAHSCGRVATYVGAAALQRSARGTRGGREGRGMAARVARAGAPGREYRGHCQRWPENSKKTADHGVPRQKR